MGALKFIEKRRGQENRYSWYPFEASDRFDAFDWWDRVPYYNDDPWYIEVRRRSEEVARVELDEKVGLRHYGVDPNVEPHALQIQFIEVANDCRRQGVATAVVAELARLHPDRTLVAYSEQADEFWSSLGWARFEHPSEPRYHQTLFIQK